jgi:hypothetical protein
MAQVAQVVERFGAMADPELSGRVLDGCTQVDAPAFYLVQPNRRRHDRPDGGDSRASALSIDATWRDHAKDKLDAFGEIFDNLFDNSSYSNKLNKIKLIPLIELLQEFFSPPIADKINRADAAGEVLSHNNPLRSLIFSVHEKTSKLLGRDLVDLAFVNAKLAVELLVSKGEIVPFEGALSDNPENWVMYNIVPKLDPDLKEMAYNVGIYKDAMPKFYKSLSVWHHRQSDGARLFFSNRSKK